jgi:hypothetical protein
MESTVDVPYIKQETSTTCWNASYKMMLRWTSMYESMADQLPHDTEMRERGILDSEFGACRVKLGLQSASCNDLSTPEGIQSIWKRTDPFGAPACGLRISTARKRKSRNSSTSWWSEA